jgi:phosphatidylserine/phosphatidylglycerophosphate/cardiolipin synthase-like enzyme
MEIMKQMLKAKKRIDFAIFTFAQSSGIDDTMIALAKAHIKIRGVLDGAQANHNWAATHPVQKAGVELYKVPKQGKLRKLHHKLMVIDKQVVIAGSLNYTSRANRLNDENIIILGDLEETNPSSIAKQKELASYTLKEIDRIISEYGEPV